MNKKPTFGATWNDIDIWVTVEEWDAETQEDYEGREIDCNYTAANGTVELDFTNTENGLWDKCLVAIKDVIEENNEELFQAIIDENPNDSHMAIADFLDNSEGCI